MNNFTQTQKKIYYIFLLLVIIWCGFILLAPYLASRGQTFSSGMIYFGFSKVCHQMASRSFFVFGHQLAVCSRCTGIYFGFLASAFVFSILIKIKKRPELSPKILFLALGLLIIDFSLGFTPLKNSLYSRFVTGFAAGAAALFFVLPGVLELEKILSKNKSDEENGEIS